MGVDRGESFLTHTESFTGVRNIKKTTVRMLLMQDRVLGETMMHLVPSCSPVPSFTFDVSQLEFDLDLLPVSLGPDSVVPGSPGQYSLCSPLDTHTTMFSPEPPTSKRSVMPPSPSSSLSPLSPYSPSSRPERRVSTQSSHSVSSSLQETMESSNMTTGINLQESLLEFTQLQDKIKLEQDLLLDHPHSSLQLSPGYPAHTRYSVSSEASSVFPLSPEPGIIQDQVPLVKIEPLETGFKDKAASNTLLKQCLSDTSFQAKYNLKPADFGITTGFVSSEASTNKEASAKTEVSGHKPLGPSLSDSVKIEPLLDLAADQVRREIAATCNMLSISPNPRDWSKEDVRSWLVLSFQKFEIPMSQLDWTLWNMDGARMVQMTEADFSDRLPSKHGENLYAQFDIWRTNYNFETGTEQQQQVATAHTQFAPPPPYPDTSYWPTPTTTGGAESIHTDTFGDIAYMLQMLDNQPPVAAAAPQSGFLTPKLEPGLSPPPYPGPTTDLTPLVTPGPTESTDFGSEQMEEDEDEEDEDSDAGGKSPTRSSPGSGRPGTNIHLWQFVKELLLQPGAYGNYIHLIDRQKGIFKIVDSVKVATLWGKRKNRPAMNYDKLSRSLRQYYKKGIMKKTERSQRLVYQFCHPYHL